MAHGGEEGAAGAAQKPQRKRRWVLCGLQLSVWFFALLRAS